MQVPGTQGPAFLCDRWETKTKLVTSDCSKVCQPFSPSLIVVCCMVDFLKCVLVPQFLGSRNGRDCTDAPWWMSFVVWGCGSGSELAICGICRFLESPILAKPAQMDDGAGCRLCPVVCRWQPCCTFLSATEALPFNIDGTTILLRSLHKGEHTLSLQVVEQEANIPSGRT